MKHLKQYEDLKMKDYMWGRDEKKLYINIPSTTYFKSDIKFQLIFVDVVYKSDEHDFDAYQIIGENAIQFNQWQDGRESFSFITWNKTYNEDDFEKIKFMTAEEFYHIYQSSYIRILEEVLDRISQNKGSDEYNNKLNEILERLTIPEVEHIISARKYNL